MSKKAQEVPSRFVTAAEAAVILGVSKPTAYRLIRTMNDELRDQGKITVAGKVSRRYFEHKVAL